MMQQSSNTRLRKNLSMISQALLMLALVSFLVAWTYGPPWLSPNDARRIQVGMTREQVEEIIGRSASEEWDVTEKIPQFHPPGQHRIRLIWDGFPVSVRAMFADNRVEWVEVQPAHQEFLDLLEIIVDKLTP
jgi:hypothetical protein